MEESTKNSVGVQQCAAGRGLAQGRHAGQKNESLVPHRESLRRVAKITTVIANQAFLMSAYTPRCLSNAAT